jgi:hypothetical protein
MASKAVPGEEVKVPVERVAKEAHIPGVACSQ